MEIKIWRVKNVVSFQIMELKNFDKYRGKGLLFSFKRFEIKSEDSPTLNDGSIFLAGRSEKMDHKVGSKHFDNETHAIRYHKEVSECLSEWRKNKFQIYSPSKVVGYDDGYDDFHRYMMRAQIEFTNRYGRNRRHDRKFEFFMGMIEDRWCSGEARREMAVDGRVDYDTDFRSLERMYGEDEYGYDAWVR